MISIGKRLWIPISPDELQELKSYLHGTFFRNIKCFFDTITQKHITPTNGDDANNEYSNMLNTAVKKVLPRNLILLMPGWKKFELVLKLLNRQVAIEQRFSDNKISLLKI